MEDYSYYEHNSFATTKTMSVQFVYHNPKQFDFLYDVEFIHFWEARTEEEQTYLKAPHALKQVMLAKNPLLLDGLPKKWHRYIAREEDFLRKQETCVWIGGRGSGKTNTIAKLIFLLFIHLPKATYGLASISYTQIEMNVLPEVWQEFERMGIFENVHYVYGVEPPESWKKPYRKPDDYKYAITFINGFTILLYSSQAPEKARGASLDGIIIDEAGFLPERFIKKTLLPTVRANVMNSDINQKVLHLKKFIFTSAPYDTDKQYIWQYEELAAKKSDRYYFTISTPIDNAACLPPNYIEDLKAELSPLEFEVEVMSKRLDRPEKPYYPKYDKAKHLHTYDFTVVNGKAIYADYDTNLPIYISIDKNDNICSMVVAQDKGASFDIINILFVHWESIPKLIELFTDEYASHNRKHVELYGDRNLYDVDTESGMNFTKLIISDLAKKGWSVKNNIRMGNIEQEQRYFVVNYALEQIEKPIRVNAVTCKDLDIAVRMTPSKDGNKKDKSSERKSNIPSQQATHITDCLDYLVHILYAKKAYRKQNRVAD
jgi:hypothetical protein